MALTIRRARATPTVTIQPITYYASAAGGRVSFNITTRLVTISTSGEQLLAALVNPSGSGKDMFLHVGEFGASAATTFRRYGGATITPTGTAISGRNTGGGSASSVAQMYVGGASPTFSYTGGVIAKDAFIAVNSTYFTEVLGATVLRPGNGAVWTIQGPQSGNFTASVYFEYYELAAAS